jgi:two-component system C4-dicarboxylate transport sensor histidine kinase DctB
LLKARILLPLVVSLSIVAGVSLAARHYWRESALQSAVVVSEQRGQLISDSIRSEINRQDHLPLMMSLDPDVRDALSAGGDLESFIKISKKLQLISREADARGLYVVNDANLVVAADDWEAADTLVGQTLAPRPYLTTAASTGKGAFVDFDPNNDHARYFVAVAVRNPHVVGVAVTRIDFDALEEAWSRAGERIMITDRNGIVFLTSDPRYKSRFLPELADGAGKSSLFDVIEQRSAGRIVRRADVDDKASYLYQAQPLADYGWTIHRLTDISAVERDAHDGTLIGGALSSLALSLFFISFQRQRALVVERRQGVRLKALVADRTQELSDANMSLQGEVEERRNAELQLRRTQNELVQAGKLAALGQMSAAIAHEINQPLAAIRTYVASTKVLMARGEAEPSARNLDLINNLAQRMADITTHLKMFARKSEVGMPETVNLSEAVKGAMLLLESQVAEAQVDVRLDLDPDVFVTGYTVQLEQAVINIVRNALDAVADVAEPAIVIAVERQGPVALLRVSDNGSGIAAADLRLIFDPFFTTKPVGIGLGLGLSITYGIVQNSGGQIRAVNRDGGGAEVTVELPVAGGSGTTING